MEGDSDSERDSGPESQTTKGLGNNDIKQPRGGAINNKIELPQTKEIENKSPETTMTESKGEKEKSWAYGRGAAPPYIEDYAQFSTWAAVVGAWSKTSPIPLKEQGFILAQELPKESSRYGATLREDVFKECPPEELINNEKGIDNIITFLKGRFWVDTEQDVYDTHDNLKTIHRKRGQALNDYIIEFDKLMKKAERLKIRPSGEEMDMCLAMDLIGTADLNGYEKMLIKSVCNVTNGDGKRYETVKAKMREILGQNGDKNIPSSDNNVLLAQNNSKTEDDIIQNNSTDEAYIAKGWKPPPNHNRRYQNSNNRYQNSNNRYQAGRNGGNNYNNTQQQKYYRTKKKNPPGPDGKPLRCLCCKANTHLIENCPDKLENKKDKKYKEVYMTNKETDQDEKFLIEISNSESEKEDNGEAFCSVYCSESKEELSSFTAEALNKAALDTCCTSSICGEKWLNIYLKALPTEMKNKIIGPKESNKHFLFGNQGRLKSIAKYTIPAKIGGEDNYLKIDVIPSDIPLLLSKGEMKRLGMSLDIKNDKGFINGKPLILTTTNAGHYVVDLLQSKEEIEEVCVTELDEDNEKVQMKALEKVHRQFGHRSKLQFVTILKEAGKWQEKFSKMIDRIMNRCEGCILRKRSPDKPAVAPPMSNDFGQVLGMDLKVWDKNKNIYILYMIDTYSRYQVATVIRSKEASEIVKAFTTKWLPIFGRVDKILTDNGGEFNNEDMREVASLLNVQLLTTGANAPWQNGGIEKNHYTTDSCLHATKRDFPDMPLEVALAWAVCAVNSMSSVRGFSPYQIVFGRNIKLPNIIEDPPPTWEEPQKSKEMMDTLNALHATRVAYTKSERCERIRRALRAKIRINDTIYEKGDIVYFKKEDENTWRGPAKVVFQDSKVIFIRIGSIYYRVSANRIIKAGEELAKDIIDKENEESKDTKENNVNEKETETVATRTVRTTRQSNQNDDNYEPDWNRLTIDEKETPPVNANEIEIGNGEELEAPITPEQEEDEAAGTSQAGQGTGTEAEQSRTDKESGQSNKKGRKRRKINQKPAPEINEDGTIKNAATILKRNDRIEILENGKWEKGIIPGHGGKVGGKHSGWYNIQLDNGQTFHDEVSRRNIRYENTDDTENNEESEEVMMSIRLDTGKTIKVEDINDRRVRLEDEDEEIALLVTADVFAVLVPKEQRDSPECMTAKMEELSKLQAFDTYKVVEDEGQDRITTTWVLTEKGTEKRARLTARGFQEDGEFPTDSPTVQKHSMKLILAIASTEGWNISTTDITSAFLQGSLMDREVYVKPPKEANMPNKLWLLNKCLYGLKDASRKWYLKVVEKLKKLGFKTSVYDSGVFYLIKDGKLIGIVALHVDDFLHAGNDFFNKVIMPQVLSCFKVGKSETKEFMYTGFFMKQTEQGVRIDQDKYVKNVKIPVVDPQLLKDKKREMTLEELTLLRQLTGVVNWTARATRPDLAFEMIDLSTKFKGGIVDDLIKAKNVAARLKKLEMSIMISNLDKLEDCEIIVYTDAAFRNLNDNTDSCGGYVIFLVNMKNGKVAPLEWKSGKLKRKVLSTLGAETQALYNGLDAAIALKLMLSELYNGDLNLGVKAITDNLSARTAVYSESEVAERQLRGDIAVIKEMIETERVKEIRWVKGEHMLADQLTKRGVNKIPLMEVLESGKMRVETLRLIRD